MIYHIWTDYESVYNDWQYEGLWPCSEDMGDKVRCRDRYFNGVCNPLLTTEKKKNKLYNSIMTFFHRWCPTSLLKSRALRGYTRKRSMKQGRWYHAIVTLIPYSESQPTKILKGFILGNKPIRKIPPGSVLVKPHPYRAKPQTSC